MRHRDFTSIRRGRRADLGEIAFRSAWEANTARWLNWRVAQGEIVGWQYEAHTFFFPGVTRGAVSYTPDFKVIYPDGSHEWLEVKGYETSADRTKLRRMRQFYPDERLTVIGKTEYRALSQQFGGLPKWES